MENTLSERQSTLILITAIMNLKFDDVFMSASIKKTAVSDIRSVPEFRLDLDRQRGHPFAGSDMKEHRDMTLT